MAIKVGDRIELVAMPDDSIPISPGSQGIVTFISDVKPLGFVQYGVIWDNGRRLSPCVPPDVIRLVPFA